MRRVVVTGLGARHAAGQQRTGDLASWLWRARVGIDWIRAFDAGEYPVRVAAEVKDFDPTGVASPKEQRKLDRNVSDWRWSRAKRSVENAGLKRIRSSSRRDCLRLGDRRNRRDHCSRARSSANAGFERVSPSFIPSVLVDAASGPDRDLARDPRAQLRARVGLCDRIARSGGGRGADQARRCGRDARGRHGGRHPGRSSWPDSWRCGAWPPRTSIRHAPPDRSTLPEPAS